jgi:hypothetical protein
MNSYQESDFVKMLEERTQEILNNSEVKKAKMPRCFICMDQGFILYKKQTKFGYEAEYILHCVCEKGQEWIYEGKAMRKEADKSHYRVPAVDEVFDIEELKKQNWESWLEKHKDETPDSRVEDDNWVQIEADLESIFD